MSENDPELYIIPPSNDGKIPRFLQIIYVILILGGIYGFYAYWNGSKGLLDRGYWQKLQQAAKTTYPFDSTSQTNP